MDPRTMLCIQKPLGKIWIGGLCLSCKYFPQYVNPDSGQGSQLSLTPRLPCWGRASPLPVLFSVTLSWMAPCPAPHHQCALLDSSWSDGKHAAKLPSSDLLTMVFWGGCGGRAFTSSELFQFLPFWRQYQRSYASHLHVRIFVCVPILSWLDLNRRLDNIANTNRRKKR